MKGLSKAEGLGLSSSITQSLDHPWKKRFEHRPRSSLRAPLGIPLTQASKNQQ